MAHGVYSREVWNKKDKMSACLTYKLQISIPLVIVYWC